MTLKQIGYGMLSFALVGLILFGKWKLAAAKPTLAILFIAGLVFAASTPAEAE